MPHRKKRRLILPLGLVLIIVAALGWTQLRPLPKPTAVVKLKVPATSAKQVALPWPAYGQAAVGTAGYGVIASHGQQTAVPTASLAKVITALAVLRQYPLRSGESGPIITITQADVDSYNSYISKDGSVVQVSLGEQITERQALEALLLPSANNIADTLARWAFGSVKAYASYANDYAKSLGLKTVTVTDPSGFLPSTMASASDMTVIGQLAMQQPVFAEIIAEPSASVPVQGSIRNYNALLGGTNVGIKTGNNDQDKGAFLFANKIKVGNQTVTIVGAIMDGPDLGTVLNDSRTLAQATALEFSETTFVHAGEPVATYTLPDHSQLTATAAQNLTVLTWNGASSSLASDIQPLSLPSPAHATVGQVTLSSDLSQTKTSVDVQIPTKAAQPTWLWRLTHPF